MTATRTRARGLASVHADIARYYTDTVKAHGPTPAGVDWACERTQQMRFIQLLRICKLETPLSLNDIGCGYGALAGFLRTRHPRAAVDYWGVDVSGAMIAHARRQHSPPSRFSVSHVSPRVADYSVASGIFNVKLDQPQRVWTGFIEATLADMRANSRKGFAFNMLAPMPGGIQGKTELYCTSPQPWIDHCERALGTRVEIAGDYGMREFTILATPR